MQSGAPSLTVAPFLLSGEERPAMQRWFDRQFQLGLGPEAAPPLIERLQLAPERLVAAIAEVPSETLTAKLDGKWSIQENAGHLLDLEPLWDRRLDDYAVGVPELHAADLENRKTH